MGCHKTGWVIPVVLGGDQMSWLEAVVQVQNGGTVWESHWELSLAWLK